MTDILPLEITRLGKYSQDPNIVNKKLGILCGRLVEVGMDQKAAEDEVTFTICRLYRDKVIDLPPSKTDPISSKIKWVKYYLPLVESDLTARGKLGFL